jgi:hypothetical protein
MNNHVGSDTMYVFLTLARSDGAGGPTLFNYNKITNAVTKVGALFDPASALSWATGEGWYFSATRPHALYLNEGSALKRYDVVTRQLETVFDVSSNPGLFGTNRMIWQLHSSNDDRVHSGTLKDRSSYAELGCFAYREDTSQFFYFPRIGAYDECHIDKSGRWLLIKENVDGRNGEDNRMIDLTTGTETRLLDENGAAGHSDNGYGYFVAADNYDNRPNAIKVWKFGQTPAQGTLVYHNNDWNVGAPNHVSHGNSTDSVAPEQQYACGSSANSSNTARANEIICFALDGSMRVLIVAPVMTNLSAPGGGDSYWKMPKGNLDVTGNYFIWTTNLGGGRLDAFIVRVPGHLLTGTTPADEEAPAVTLTAPSTGAVIAGPTTLSAAASDNVGVAGVQFKVDGANVGAEDTTAPYSVSWSPSSAANGPRTLTATARDAAGNTTTSNDVNVDVDVDTIPPTITGVAASSVSASGATISWTTSESANSQVEYGPTIAYGSATPLNSTLASAHTSTLGGLAAGTGYHYRVKSRDAAGNLATSGDFAFTTLSAPPPPPPSSGLITYWPFDDGGGTSAADASGNGNTATLVNGPLWTAGQVNQALVFDGINDHVTAPHTGALNAFPLTVVAWIKTSSATGTVGIVNKYVAGSRSGYNLFMNGGALCAWYFRNSSSSAYDGGNCTLRATGYNDNLWHHVAYVVDGSSARLYVDGALKGSQAWTGNAGSPTTTQPIQVGRYPGVSGTQYFPGSIDEVRVYNRSLTALEIGALMQSAPPSPPTNLIGYWPLDDGAGTTAVDASGGGQPGTLLNGPTWTPGRHSQALVFDGVNDYVNIAPTASQNAFPLTVAAWIKTSSTTGIGGIVNKYVAGSFNGYNVFLNGGSICAWFLRSSTNYIYDGGGCTHSSSGYNDNQWHHVVYVVDASGAKLYVDGAQKSSLAWTGAAGPTTTSQALQIGRYPGAGTSHFGGTIDDVRVYNRALTASEVLSLYGNAP